MGRAPTNIKQKLIETASSLIWQNSYASVSVDDICKAAGAKKGSFYYYFASKAELALETIEEGTKEYLPILEDIFSPARDPIERFEKYLDVMYQMQVETAEKYGKVCGCPHASLGSEIAGQEEELRAKIEQMFARKIAYFKDALTDMIALGYIPKETDVECLSSRIHAYILGEITVARIQNDLEPIRRNLKNNIFNMIGISSTTRKIA